MNREFVYMQAEGLGNAFEDCKKGKNLENGSKNMESVL